MPRAGVQCAALIVSQVEGAGRLRVRLVSIATQKPAAENCDDGHGSDPRQQTAEPGEEAARDRKDCRRQCEWQHAAYPAGDRAAAATAAVARTTSVPVSGAIAPRGERTNSHAHAGPN